MAEGGVMKEDEPRTVERENPGHRSHADRHGVMWPMWICFAVMLLIVLSFFWR